MTTNLQNDGFMNHYEMVGEREVGLKFYPRNTPLALTSPNDVTVTPIEIECTTADAGPAGCRFYSGLLALNREKRLRKARA